MIEAALVFHFQKALNRLKQTLYMWYFLILEFFQKQRFTEIGVDHIVFVFNDKLIFISVYMNNFFDINNDLNIINALKNKLSEYFQITDVESVFHHRGIFCTKTENFVRFNQKNYLKNILIGFEKDICKPASSPIDS